ncbi:hypothetical protein ACFU44_17575 [Nocardia rhizosphaerihabitans]|uniref:hypothetical protein n=1 Tax=Nocardia rhizosphaerihabitans TaxID=1691570 RepID=UPI00366E725E
MSSGSDDRRNDPTVFGGSGAPHQPDAQWQRPDAVNPPPGAPAQGDPAAGQPNPGAPDPTAVWTPGSTGLPPTLRWDGSGPMPGLPDPTPWTPAGPQQWDAGSPAGQPSSQQPWQPGQSDATQLRNPTQPPPGPAASSPAGQPGSPQPWQPGQADATQLRNPAAPWPDPNAPTSQPGQADATQLRNPAAPWPGANPAAVQPGSPQPWQPGQADATQLRTPNAPWPGSNPPAGQQIPGQQWGTPPAAPAEPQWGAGQVPNQQPWNPAVGQPNPAQQWGQSDPTVLGRVTWQQPQQQYGEIPPLKQFGNQPYGQQPYGQPIPPGPKSGGKAAIWVAAGLAAVLLVGGAVTAVALTRGDDSTTTAGGGTTPSMVSALTTTGAPPSSSKPKPSSTTPSPSGAASDRKPFIEGYQVVASPDRGAAYDVPPSWKVATETTIGGVGEPPGDSVVGKGYATDGRDYCPGSTRTMSLLTGSKQADHAAAGAELGTKAAPLAYKGSTGTPGPAQPLKSIDGKTEGMFTETTGTVPNPKPGCAPTFSIYTYAFKGAKDGSFVMVMIADTGVADAIDPATAKRIFSSIRALN